MSRPFDQDLDNAHSAYVEALGRTEDTQSAEGPAPECGVFCALEWALRCIGWLIVAAVISMLLANIAAF